MLDLFSNKTFVFFESLYSLALPEVAGDSSFNFLLSESVACGWLALFQNSYPGTLTSYATNDIT